MDTLSKLVGTTLVGLVATAALTGCGSDERDDASKAGAEPMVLTLPATGAGLKCAVPSADLLQNVETAFEGTVAAIDDSGDVTLEVDAWMQGADEPGEVTIAAPETDLSGLVPVVSFEEGKTYLVSATDGAVSVCGLSGEKSSDLEAIYAEAFGR